MIRAFFRPWGLLACALVLVCGYPALASAGGKKDKSPYIAMGTLSATLFDDMRPSGVVLVDVNLAVPKEDDKDSVNALLPLLHDRYLQILSQLASSTYQVDRPIDLAYLTQRLQKATDKVTGNGIATVQIASAMAQGR